ncbi:TetR/AcrR family transcriptional regulator [Novosphingobium humi]|uniref:TetR/AcrR family transcriptional regulator n=1 Tax=Novosphingobium humi TaxID=2282397 RepID=A0ABY7U142_9SPHN|nr:TetR/AcrR family transcriptional regulator [Novosphingobium humi]WCT79228.1 TetR/AcrR family transcriptional regulator [Novosphingobium humi]
MASDELKKSKRDIILDAAEALFAVHGFDGVSMRMIAERAPVGLGLLTHHFPAKDQLFVAVLERRADIINMARLAALDALDKPDMEALLTAFLQPYVDRIAMDDEGWRAYARLHAMMTQDARWTPVAAAIFGPVAEAMIARMQDVEPRLTHEMAVRGYVFLLGGMVSMFADTRLLDRLTDGRLSSADVSASFGPIVRFAAAGIRALGKQDGDSV